MTLHLSQIGLTLGLTFTVDALSGCVYWIVAGEAVDAAVTGYLYR